MAIESDSASGPNTTGVLTKLQRMALERIRFFERELKEKYGITAKCGLELEFYLLNKSTRFPQRISEQNILKLRSECQGEDVFASMVADNNSGYQYEVITKPDAPETVAAGTLKLKNIIQRTAQDEKLGQACFDDYSAFTDFKRPPSALHVNVSLWNENGNSLFYETVTNGESQLLNNCTKGVLNVQKGTVLATGTEPQSYPRLNSPALYCAPKRIDRELRKHKGGSLTVRRNSKNKDHLNQGSIVPEELRIENRLPGASTDPYVAVAVTLAGIYDAVTKTVTCGTDRTLIVRPYGDYYPAELPRTIYGAMMEYAAYEKDCNGKNSVIGNPEVVKQTIELLGELLYNAILEDAIRHKLRDSSPSQ